jgi:hypothetical protein
MNIHLVLSSLLTEVFSSAATSRLGMKNGGEVIAVFRGAVGFLKSILTERLSHGQPVYDRHVVWG